MKDEAPQVVFLIDGKPVTDQLLSHRLPTGLSSETPEIRYEDYFCALRAALGQGSWEPLRHSLAELIGEWARSGQIRRVSVDSVKHGALYDVAKVTVRGDAGTYALAVNSARDPRRHGDLEREWNTLRSLARTPAAPYLPRGLYRGSGLWRDVRDEERPFRFFLAPWFEGFHEWHMEKGGDGTAQGVRVWDESPSGRVLSDAQACCLLEQAAYVLTLALDREGFRHIYPWHHAAGDFILCLQDQKVAVRLISARNQTVFIAPGPQRHERLSAVTAFFFALTFRLRLDRDQGTGDFVWAPSRWLGAAVKGFLRGWEDGKVSTEPLSTEEILTAFQSFDVADWETVGRLLEEDLVVDAEEGSVVSHRIPEHARDLSQLFARELATLTSRAVPATHDRG